MGSLALVKFVLNCKAELQFPKVCRDFSGLSSKIPPKRDILRADMGLLQESRRVLTEGDRAHGLALKVFGLWEPTHRPSSKSFTGLPYRILNINSKRNYLGAYGYAGFGVKDLAWLVSAVVRGSLPELKDVGSFIFRGCI